MYRLSPRIEMTITKRSIPAQKLIAIDNGRLRVKTCRSIGSAYTPSIPAPKLVRQCAPQPPKRPSTNSRNPSSRSPLHPEGSTSAHTPSVKHRSTSPGRELMYRQKLEIIGRAMLCPHRKSSRLILTAPDRGGGYSTFARDKNQKYLSQIKPRAKLQSVRFYPDIAN